MIEVTVEFKDTYTNNYIKNRYYGEGNTINDVKRRLIEAALISNDEQFNELLSGKIINWVRKDGKVSCKLLSARQAKNVRCIAYYDANCPSGLEPKDYEPPYVFFDAKTFSKEER